MKKYLFLITIILGMSSTYGEAVIGYINSVHQATEYENCTIQGKASSNFTTFALKLDNGTIMNFCIDASTDQGKRITASILLAFSNSVKVLVLRIAEATVICGGTTLTGYNYAQTIDLLQN
jgi:hypothetical protein